MKTTDLYSFFTKSSTQLLRTPLHLPVRDDDLLNRNRNVLQRCAVGGLATFFQTFYVKLCTCNEIRSPGNPFDTREKLLASNLHRTDCCAPPKANLQFSARFLSKLAEKSSHFRYRRQSSREFACSNMSTNPARDE